jgi:hypothetical protein
MTRVDIAFKAFLVRSLNHNSRISVHRIDVIFYLALLHYYSRYDVATYLCHTQAIPDTFVAVMVKLNGGDVNWLYLVWWVPEKL